MQSLSQISNIHNMFRIGLLNILNCFMLMYEHILDSFYVGQPFLLKGHCIEFKYYADGIHSGLTPPG